MISGFFQYTKIPVIRIVRIKKVLIKNLILMRKIIKDVETGAPVNPLKFNIQKDIERSVTDTICHHSCLLAEQVSAEAKFGNDQPIVQEVFRLDCCQAK